jgi:hypothetical protein
VLLGRVEDLSYITGQIGLAAGAYEGGGGVHVAFDNLVVYRLP